jgi:hypothetical protein
MYTSRFRKKCLFRIFEIEKRSGKLRKVTQFSKDCVSFCSNKITKFFDVFKIFAKINWTLDNIDKFRKHSSVYFFERNAKIFWICKLFEVEFYTQHSQDICKQRMFALERTSHHDALGIHVKDVNKVRVCGIQPHIYLTEVLKFETDLPSWCFGIRVNDVHKVHVNGIQPHIYHIEVLKIWNRPPIMMLLESMWKTSTKSVSVGSSQHLPYWSIKIWNGPPIMMLWNPCEWRPQSPRQWDPATHLPHWSIKDLEQSSYHDALGIHVKDVDKVRVCGIQPTFTLLKY